MNQSRLLQIIESIGFQQPTKVQTESYKAFMENKQAVIMSPTGTGKTHAYLIPLMEKIDLNLNEIQAVIVVPTNELVMQVDSMFKQLNSPITYKTISAKEDRKRTIESFKSSQPQIVIATPGRLLDLAITENVAKIYTAKYLILDEADMLFDFDFMTQLNAIVKAFKGDTYIYSATMPENLYSWIRTYFGHLTIMDLSDSEKLDIDHYLIKAGMDKDYRLLQLLDAINPYLCLIFVSKNDDIETLYQMMLEKEFNVARLSSTLPLRQRKVIIDEVKQLRYQYLIASDIMARGIDIEGISHIINYDLPYKIEFYIHRSGRTGRMGAHGEVYSFYEDKFSRKFETLRNRGVDFKFVKIRNNQIVVEEPKTRKLTAEEVQAIRKIKKPTKVKPGYKKKNKRKIKQAIQKVRYGEGGKK